MLLQWLQLRSCIIILAEQQDLAEQKLQDKKMLEQNLILAEINTYPYRAKYNSSDWLKVGDVTHTFTHAHVQCAKIEFGVVKGQI